MKKFLICALICIWWIFAELPIFAQTELDSITYIWVDMENEGENELNGGITPFAIEHPVVPALPPDSFILQPPAIPAFPREPLYPEVPTVDPEKPSIPTVEREASVGMTEGNMTVNHMGAAQYQIPIKIPNGGTLCPQFSLVHNSQSIVYGLAGLGMTVSGFSSITRGGKDMFHDKAVKGVTYTVEDNLYLEGKRLILQSGSPCQENATYTLEGDPFTKIIAHGAYTSSTATTWFEVISSDGKKYEYGNTPDSRISFTSDLHQQRIATWYVNRIEDQYSNYVTFQYLVSNLHVYPQIVCYGMNAVKDRGLINKVEFEYENLGVQVPNFHIGSKKGFIDKRLASITTSSNEQVFRKYNLKYATDIDKSNIEFVRLKSIREENGAGEFYDPTLFKWEGLPSATFSQRRITNPTLISDPDKEMLDQNYLAVDINGDGVSDIVRISTTKVQCLTSQFIEVHLYISLSSMSSNGAVKYAEPIMVNLGANYSNGDESFGAILGGAQVADVDGDGLNDLIFPFIMKDWNGYWSKEIIEIIYGKTILSNNRIKKGTIDVPLTQNNTELLHCFFDANGDGIDEILCLETKELGGMYRMLEVKDLTDYDVSFIPYDLQIPKKPEKLFRGDFNNDGLTDIIILYAGGYALFYNQGSAKNGFRFSNEFACINTNSDLQDGWRVVQGDFNGDGLLDFVVVPQLATQLIMALNNGDGTFTTSLSEDIGLFDNYITDKDDHRYVVQVLDLDKDGYSDIFVMKASYDKNKNYVDTKYKWLFSNGTKLKVGRSFIKTREADADEGSVFVGDFDGDGNFELANYGSDLTVSNVTVEESYLHIYKNPGVSSKTGKLVSVTDGMGNQTSVEYSYSTVPEVCTSDLSKSSYPKMCYNLPINVVKSVNYSNGVAGSRLVKYEYGDFMIHLTAGVLGFDRTSCHDSFSGMTTTSIINRDDKYLIPEKTQVISKVGEQISTTIRDITVAAVENNYFAYESSCEMTDFDGNNCKISSKYDTAKGVLIEQKTINEEGMYKQVNYSQYSLTGGRYQPGVMKITQKHKDDSNPHIVTTQYTYDSKGNPTMTRVNFSAPEGTSTLRNYDVYGNVLTDITVGKSGHPIKKLREYDSTGRFIVKESQEPAGAILSYTHDLWGNVLSESDITDSSVPLVTKYSYNNWGEALSVSCPDGTGYTTTSGWGKTASKQYYKLTSPVGQPWVLTWFDRVGHETMKETFGAKNILIRTETSYNTYGQVSRVRNIKGKMHIINEITYDDFGRVILNKQGVSTDNPLAITNGTVAVYTGKEVSYAYGNRSVTTIISGRSSSKSMDAWGNIVEVTDAAGGKVITTYWSNGLPHTITSNGVTITKEYNLTGLCTYVSDPNQGESFYTYDGDGKLVSSVDGNGVKTTYTFDNLGRVTKTQVGSSEIKYVYGAAGRDRLRLAKKFFGNNTIAYTYDKYGRVVTEKRVMDGKSADFNYTYTSNNQLKQVSYPGGLTVLHTYDNYGHLIGRTAAGKSIYKLKDNTGVRTESIFADSLVSVSVVDSYGYPIRKQVALGDSLIDKMIMRYNPVTDNLQYRARFGMAQEDFAYDNLERLVLVTVGNTEMMRMSYSANGNIMSKTGIGDYSYNPVKPHAVSGIDNTDGRVSSGKLTFAYDDFRMISLLQDNSTRMSLEFFYDPDGQRCHTLLRNNGDDVRHIYYAKGYEKIEEDSNNREFYYIGGDVLIVKKEGQFYPYFIFKDNLGSILSVMDENGVKVFHALYDAWGKQDIRTNTIGLFRGYTGHEMLPEFGLINMNARLYDSDLGRFLSPDQNIQYSNYTQCYNPYSYCLNNPLKYNDPSGNIFNLIGVGLFQGILQSMFISAVRGENIFAGIGSAIFSIVGPAAVGEIFGAIGSVGNEFLRAGAHGLTSAIESAVTGGNCGKAFITGAVSSGIGSFAYSSNINSTLKLVSCAVAGGVTAWVIGSNIIEGALQGMRIGILNHAQHDNTTQLSEGNYSSTRPSIVPNEDGSYKIVWPDGIDPYPLTFNGGKVDGSILDKIDSTTGDVSDGNTVLGAVGSSLEKNGANSTVGSNGRVYYKSKTQAAFNGNQYVKTAKLSSIGKNISHVTKRATFWLSISQIASGLGKDLHTLRQTGSSNLFHFVKASAEALGGYWGAELGATAGAALTSEDSPAGMIVGGAVGGIGGGIGGARLAGDLVDWLYGK